MAERRKKKIARLGNVVVGGGRPVAVQSMTSTISSDIGATVKQVRKLDEAGCEIIRVSVPDLKSVSLLPGILSSTRRPIVADIHFNHLLAVESIRKGVQGIRINPGNIGSRQKVFEIIEVAKDFDACIRIGINSGSLDKKYLIKGKVTPQGLVDSALEYIDLFESKRFLNLKVSIKSSSVTDTILANRLFDSASDYPIHLGVTESGTLLYGSIRSSVAMGILLNEGIGDTIRVSLSTDPVKEVRVAWEILKALGLRKRGVTVIACPTCSRKSFNVSKVSERIEAKLSGMEKPLTVAVMGCIVNGPGEASHAHVGVAGGKGRSVIFEKGRIVAKVKNSSIEREIMTRVARLAKGKS